MDESIFILQRLRLVKDDEFHGVKWNITTISFFNQSINWYKNKMKCV